MHPVQRLYHHRPSNHVGVSFADIQTKFGRKLLSYCQKQAQPHINQGLLLQTDDKLILSKSGIFVSDGIMSDLLWV